MHKRISLSWKIIIIYIFIHLFVFFSWTYQTVSRNKILWNFHPMRGKKSQSWFTILEHSTFISRQILDGGVCCIEYEAGFVCHGHKYPCVNYTRSSSILTNWNARFIIKSCVYEAGADLDRCIRCECISQIFQSIYKIVMILISV